LKRFIPFTFLVAVLACFAAGSASALTFQDQTCDNSKPSCILPSGQADVPYQFDMFARSGCPPYHYNITGGTPPPGLTLTTVNDSSNGGIGRLAGTPTTPGSYSFYVTISTPESPTCLGDRADRLFEIAIGPAPLAITTSSLKTGVVGQPYSYPLTASGSASQSWSASGLPGGLALSGNTITGTPTAAGDFTVTITVSNGTTTKSSQVPLKILEPLKVTAPAGRAAEVGRPFSATFTATGGSGTHTWAASDVPAGLTFDAATAAVAGTPTVAGTYTVKITLTDTGAGVTQQLNLTLKVAAHVAISTKRLKVASVRKAYALKLKATGGVRPLTWRSLGRMPAGIKLDTRAGAIVGTPRTAGTFRLIVRVTDGLRAVSTRTLVLKVKA
jgi:Putative Ig domain